MATIALRVTPYKALTACRCGFIQTIVVIVIGNVVGCTIFGLCAVMGHRTGVNQLTLSRLAFGRRGAYLPAAMQLLATIGWTGVYTWLVLDLTLGILDQLGVHGSTGLKYGLAIGLMIIQLGIAFWGFYLIRSFEKYTAGRRPSPPSRN